MKFRVIQQNLVDMQVDAIVNSANPKPWHGSGTDHSVYEGAGLELEHAREKIGEMKPGTVAITEGYQLKSKYVIHAVAAEWQDGSHGEKEVLADCYKKSLELARSKHLQSIAFPLLGTGYYAVPIDVGFQIAIHVFTDYIITHPDEDMEIFLALLADKAVSLARKLFDVQTYITRAEKSAIHDEEYAPWYERYPDLENPYKERSAVSFNSNNTKNFGQQLNCMLESRNTTAAALAGRLKMQRGSLSNLINNKRQASPEMVYKIAVGLKLGYDDTALLLRKAKSSYGIMDKILERHLIEENWEMSHIDQELIENNQEPLFSEK